MAATHKAAKLDAMADLKLPSWPAPERNKQPILEVLEAWFSEGLILELAAGTGQHAVHFAAGLTRVQWQPSEADDELLSVIQARVTTAGLPNLLPPLRLDVSAAVWPIGRAAGIFCANLVHISPWEVTLGMFAGAKRTLGCGGRLISYGPYLKSGVHTSASNADFDASLRRRNPEWGVRDIDELERCAVECGFALAQTIPMPANNLTLVWQRG